MKVSCRPFVVVVLVVVVIVVEVVAKQVLDSASHSQSALKVLWKSQLCTMRSQFLAWALYWIPVTVNTRVRARTVPVQAGLFRHASDSP